jgi:hypothetical protein
MRPEDSGAGRLSWWHEVSSGERDLAPRREFSEATAPPSDQDDDEDHYPHFDDEDG